MQKRAAAAQKAGVDAKAVEKRRRQMEEAHAALKSRREELECVAASSMGTWFERGRAPVFFRAATICGKPPGHACRLGLKTCCAAPRLDTIGTNCARKRSFLSARNKLTWL